MPEKPPPQTVIVPAQAGGAVIWKAFQLAGIKLIFLVRLAVLARILLPDAFGLVALAVIPIGVLLQVTNLGMVPALVQYRDAEVRHYNAAWTIGLLRALTVTTVVFLAAPLIGELAAEPRATSIIRILALRPLLEAAASIKVAHLIRELDFRTLAGIKVFEALVNTVVSIVLAPSLGVWALVIGNLVGTSAYVLASYVRAPHRPRFVLDRAAAGVLLRFGRWIFLTGLLAVAASSVLRLIVARRLGTAELGLYYLAASLAFLPAEAAGEVLGAVTFPLHARLQSDLRKATRAFRATLTGISALLLPVTGLIFVLAPSLVHDVLGPRWQETLPLIRILAAAGLLGLLGDVTVPILKGLGQPYKVTVLEALQSSLLIALAWQWIGPLGLVGVALARLPAVGVSQVASAFLVRQALPRPFSGLGMQLLAIAGSSAAGAASALGVVTALNGAAGLLLAGLVGVTMTYGSLWAVDRCFELGLAGDLIRLFPRLAALSPSSEVDP